MKLSTYAIKICKSYRQILKEEGALSREELLKMLKVDGHIPEKFKNDVGLNLMVSEILRNKKTALLQ